MPKIMKTLNTIHRCQSVFRNEKANIELCSAHHPFVFAICREPGRTQEELSRDLCLNKSTVARACSQLEERGYIRREPNSKDKRQSLVFPTEKMLGALPEIRAVSAEWNKIITSGISDEELEIFNSVLSRMEKSAKASIAEIGEDAE